MITTSIFIVNIPSIMKKEELERLFSKVNGYISTKLVITNKLFNIGYINYDSEKNASYAIKKYHGYRYNNSSDRGFYMKMLENKKEEYSKNKNKRRINYAKNNNNSNEKSRQISNIYQRNRSRSISAKEINSKNHFIKNIHKDKNAEFSKKQKHNSLSHKSVEKVKIKNGNITTNSPKINNLNYCQNNTNNSDNDLNNSENFFEMFSNEQKETLKKNLQALSLLSSININDSNFNIINNSINCEKKNANDDIDSKKENSFNSLVEEDDANNSNIQNANDDLSSKIESTNNNATKIVYVEGIPLNATVREVSHIFRPFPGFKRIRLIKKHNNDYKICFADFENEDQSTICINTLQGYKFDIHDVKGLHFSYGFYINN